MTFKDNEEFRKYLSLFLVKNKNIATKSEIAKHMNISKQNLSRILSHKKNIDIEIVQKILNVFGYELDIIIKKKEEIKTDDD